MKGQDRSQREDYLARRDEAHREALRATNPEVKAQWEDLAKAWVDLFRKQWKLHDVFERPNPGRPCD